MRCERVAKCVRVRRCQRARVNYSSHIPGAKSATPAIDEQCHFGLVRRNLRTKDCPRCECDQRRLAHGNSALLVALTRHDDCLLFHIHAVNVERTQFAYAQSASIEQFDNCRITRTLPIWVFIVCCMQKCIELFVCEHLWKPTGISWGAHTRGWINVNFVVTH